MKQVLIRRILHEKRLNKKTVKTIFLLVTFCGIACAQTGMKNHTITVDIKEEPYVFGNPIWITVRYANNETGDWNLQAPDNSFDVTVHCAPAGNTDNSKSYTMGKVRTIPGTAGAPMAFSMPGQKHIVIRPGEQHILTTDICESLTGLIFPGKGVLWVEDKRENLKSEPAGFQIVFNLAMSHFKELIFLDC